MIASEFTIFPFIGVSVKSGEVHLTIRITVESDVKDCYELRDAVASSILGIKAITGSEIDDSRNFYFLICGVDMPKAGKYGLLLSRKTAPPRLI